MKRIVGLALFSLAILGLTIGAQAQQHSIIVNVPFEFVLGNKVLPAGIYTVTSHLPGFVQVESADGQLTARIAATQSYYDAGDFNKLIFNQYGDRNSLHRILCPLGTSMNADLPISTFERKVRSDAQEPRIPIAKRFSSRQSERGPNLKGSGDLDPFIADEERATNRK